MENLYKPLKKIEYYDWGDPEKDEDPYFSDEKEIKARDNPAFSLQLKQFYKHNEWPLFFFPISRSPHEEGVNGIVFSPDEDNDCKGYVILGNGIVSPYVNSSEYTINDYMSYSFHPCERDDLLELLDCIFRYEYLKVDSDYFKEVHKLWI